MPTDIRQIGKITEELCEKRDIANPARDGVIGPQKRENSAKSGMVGISEIANCSVLILT